jgi:hypothetical protein
VSLGLPQAKPLAAAASFTQPVAGSHESTVHAFPSSQATGEPGWQEPSEQVSPVVQALLSEQEFELSAVNTHPLTGSHVSSVQALPSAQAMGVPMHAPFAQASVVHALLSEQEFVSSGVNTHPLAGSHVSSVQTLLSSQLGAGPPAQSPATQASAVVHALLSEQEFELSAVNTHPPAGSHVSSVQAFPSSQAIGVFTHAPFAQASVVHALLSEQSGAGPPTHIPPEQVSVVVQALPSLHGPELFV